MVLCGHGTRDREARGPLDALTPARALVIWVRRFLCRLCGVSCTVGPAGMLSRRRYTGLAIALALTLWGLERVPAVDVRARVSPDRQLGFTAGAGWASLSRWAQAVTWGTVAVASGSRGRACETAERLIARSPLPMTASHVERAVAAAQIS